MQIFRRVGHWQLWNCYGMFMSYNVAKIAMPPVLRKSLNFDENAVLKWFKRSFQKSSNIVRRSKLSVTTGLWWPHATKISAERQKKCPHCCGCPPIDHIQIPQTTTHIVYTVAPTRGSCWPPGPLFRPDSLNSFDHLSTRHRT